LAESDVCTYLTVTAELAGSGRGVTDEWFAVRQAVVSFDHPQDAPLDHALCIDVRGADARLAVELDAASARRLAEAILGILDDEETRALT
jgi:hypothetical protein